MPTEPVPWLAGLKPYMLVALVVLILALQAVGQSLGENGYITPLLSAWLGNIVFGILGIGLLTRVKK